MDPFNLFESLAFVNANQPEQSKTITCMDLGYYNAAAEGKIEVFKDITDQSLDLLLTPNKNTVLHIYLTALKSRLESTTPNPPLKSRTNFVENIFNIVLNFGSKSTTLDSGLESTTTPNVGSESRTNFVEEILIMCPRLLRQANAKGEIPLHIAARYGHDDIVNVLIKCCAPTLHQDLEGGIELVKEMLRMTNKEKDTALHEAARYNHLEVVELLIKEDPNFSYSANNAGETPLYIAAERGFTDVQFEILNKCKSPMHGGPLGRTALHAAAIPDGKGMTSEILYKIEGISREVDNNGWTPLHLAAYFNCSGSAELLLYKDREVAYMKDPKGRTALHIAAQRGNDLVMSHIVSRCPDCCELVDNRGWNVLHFAMKTEYGRLEDMIKIIIKNSSLSNLLNEKNADGDTPLHYYANSWKLAYNFLNHPRVDKMAFNKQNLSVVDIISTDTADLSSFKLSQIWNALRPLPVQRVITYYEDEDKKDGDGDKEDKEDKDKDEDKKDGDGDKEDKEDKDKDEDKKKRKEESLALLQKASEAHLVVAALITTVTFAACITMPGGFAGGGEGSHPGSALLRRNAAFKAFVITDTISMVFSSSAVFIHLLMPLIVDKHFNKERRERILFLAFKFILGAMVAMVLAFVTGTYAVLVPSLDLAIPNCIIGLTFFASLVYGHLTFIGE